MNYLSLLPLWEILLKGVLFRAPDFQKAIFLTFDDGPDPQTTPKILNQLAAFDARATFFVRGDRVPTAPGLLHQMYRQGHTIGNHGFSHIPLWNKKRRDMIREIDDATRVIQKTIGTQPQFFRPPYGRLRPGMIKLTANLGLKTVLWSVDSRDYVETTSVQEVVRAVLTGAQSGSIILFHDAGSQSTKTVQALPTILQNLSHRGFRLLPLSSLLTLPRSEEVAS